MDNCYDYASQDYIVQYEKYIFIFRCAKKYIYTFLKIINKR